MKKYIVTALSLFAAFNLSAQITLEKSYPVNNGGNANDNDLQVIRLEISGHKYALRDLQANQVRLYNLDHSIWKTINVTLPAGYSTWSHSYISERLFNLDAAVELLVRFSPATSGVIPKMIVLSENGGTLYTIDSTSDHNIFTTGNDYKLLVQKIPNKWEVYALPGSIPCDKCGNGLGLGKVLQPGNGGSLGEPIPNPSNGNVEIKYELPVGTREGQIDVYNTNGQIVKSFQVDGTFNSIRLDNSSFTSGVYYYSLRSNGQRSEAKRMIVVP
ncbi:T9SS type A sorting domain-containing protein [Polluticoccus soli]|uniref:T9SS type A sorting domain-containing protein n=1 Tax=Polluticoccus soli TaxID=3034150 RepID=UPI0023E30EBF|nr:T9SS type A sorting domain-containing protein [Flavipsychrobacter sp. JY13-12]